MVTAGMVRSFACLIVLVPVCAFIRVTDRNQTTYCMCHLTQFSFHPTHNAIFQLSFSSPTLALIFPSLFLTKSIATAGAAGAATVVAAAALVAAVGVVIVWAVWVRV